MALTPNMCKSTAVAVALMIPFRAFRLKSILFLLYDAR
jgi:hypothetical protein